MMTFRAILSQRAFAARPTPSRARGNEILAMIFANNAVRKKVDQLG